LGNFLRGYARCFSLNKDPLKIHIHSTRYFLMAPRHSLQSFTVEWTARLLLRQGFLHTASGDKSTCCVPFTVSLWHAGRPQGLSFGFVGGASHPALPHPEHTMPLVTTLAAVPKLEEPMRFCLKQIQSVESVQMDYL